MLTESITGAFDLDDNGMVEQPIKECGGDNRIAEDLAPFCAAAVRREGSALSAAYGRYQRAAESPHFGARNFPHLAGTAISRLSDQDLRFLAVDREA